MDSKIARTMAISLTVGLLAFSAGCATPDQPGGSEATADGSAPIALSTAPDRLLAQRVIAFVAYFDDAAHTNLVGAATFSQCPADPSYSWGVSTAFYTIESEPCG